MNTKQALAFYLAMILFSTTTICLAEDKQADDKKKPATKQKKETQELSAKEKKFQEMMSGATLSGHFTIEGEKGNKPAADKYTLGKVSKIKGDKWRFVARIQYLNQDLSIALPPIEVKWAGDTPVISVTKFSVPILGTYSARVLVYEGYYAGTWSGKDHGGLMYGKIITAKQKKKNAAKKESGEKK